MKTQITTMAATALLVLGIVAVPTQMRALTGAACGKESTNSPPQTMTSTCPDECTISKNNPPEATCGNSVTPGHYCKLLNEDEETCTIPSTLTVTDGGCAGQYGAWLCIDVGNAPWYINDHSTATVPCYDGVDFELCPPQS